MSVVGEQHRSNVPEQQQDFSRITDILITSYCLTKIKMNREAGGVGGQGILLPFLWQFKLKVRKIKGGVTTT